MLNIISVFLFVLNIFKILDLPEEPKPMPLCSLTETVWTGTYIFPCAPTSTCPNTTCDHCKLFGLYLSCPGNCCIDQITFSTTDQTCFTGCGFLEIFTRPTWAPDRDGTICTSANLVVTPVNCSNCYLCDGETLVVKLCASKATTLDYLAHYTCPGGTDGYITGHIVIS